MIYAFRSRSERFTSWIGSLHLGKVFHLDNHGLQKSTGRWSVQVQHGRTVGQRHDILDHWFDDHVDAPVRGVRQ